MKKEKKLNGVPNMRISAKGIIAIGFQGISTSFDDIDKFYDFIYNELDKNDSVLMIIDDNLEFVKINHLDKKWYQFF